MSFIVEIASVPDRDDVVAEVWWNDIMVAEVHRAPSGGFELDIYPRSDGPWTFDLQSWLTALDEAQKKLR